MLAGVLAPMPSELRPLVRALSLTRDGAFFTGELPGARVVAAPTGIGTKLATEAAGRLLDAHAVDHVVVCGIAGGLGASRVGDVLVPEVVIDKASGDEFRAAPLAGFAAAGRLVTHDEFAMGADEQRALVAAGIVAVDMETSAVAAVCASRDVPWSAVRVISDLVGVTPNDVIGLVKPDGSPDAAASIRYLVTKPWRIPRLARLARDSERAARRAAETVARSLRLDPHPRP